MKTAVIGGQTKTVSLTRTGRSSLAMRQIPSGWLGVVLILKPPIKPEAVTTIAAQHAAARRKTGRRLPRWSGTLGAVGVISA